MPLLCLCWCACAVPVLVCLCCACAALNIVQGARQGQAQRAITAAGDAGRAVGGGRVGVT